MGEYSEMMLDGSSCEGCGEYLGGDEHGLPLLCGTCARERRARGHEVVRLGGFWSDQGKQAAKAAAQLKVRCPSCKKYVKAAGLQDHVRVVHQQPADIGPAINT